MSLHPERFHDDFLIALRQQFSEAAELAQIAVDPDLEHRNGDSYPPVLTSYDYVNEYSSRTDETHHQTKGELERDIRKRLLRWTGEEFFELVPIDKVHPADDEVGFRITDKGMAAAAEAFRDRFMVLSTLANQVDRKRQAIVQS